MAKICFMKKLYNFYPNNNFGNSQVLTATQQLTLLAGVLLYTPSVILQLYFDR